jgi:hypothetical protein
MEEDCRRRADVGETLGYVEELALHVREFLLIRIDADEMDR